MTRICPITKDYCMGEACGWFIHYTKDPNSRSPIPQNYGECAIRMMGFYAKGQMNK